MTTLLAAWNRLDENRDRSELYRMWAVGSSAGFTTSKTLETMGARRDARAESIRRWLRDGTSAGRGVADLVRADGGNRLDRFDGAMLTLGDESGTLEESLRLLADFHARKHRAMLTIKKQLTYPLFTGMVATVIAPLPLLVTGHSGTYVVIVMTGLAAWAIAGGAVVTAISSTYERKPGMVRARFARALATAVEAGLPLGRALPLVADASADPAVRRFVGSLDERTMAGEELTRTLARCPGMTPDFLAVLVTAELTGDFTNSLRKLAELYEDGFR